MEILFLFRKLVLTQSDTHKTVPVTHVINSYILQRNYCSMFVFLLIIYLFFYFLLRDKNAMNKEDR